MQNQFEIAGGSVAGRDHVLAGRNNQDAFAWHQDDKYTIAVVSDGCSEGPQSEIGAKLGARCIVEAIRRVLLDPVVYEEREGKSDRLHFPSDLEALLEEVRTIVCAYIEDTALPMASGDRRALPRIICDSFLFTVVGCIVAPWGTALFSIGDGLYAVNGTQKSIGPFPGNEPPYLAYGLLPRSTFRRTIDFSFRVHEVIPTEAVETLLIGTDGVGAFVSAQDRCLPGKEELVGPLSQFWTEDRYFRNPDAIRRRLTLANREATHIDWEAGAVEREGGLLPDDATLVVIRRKS